MQTELSAIQVPTSRRQDTVSSWEWAGWLLLLETTGSAQGVHNLCRTSLFAGLMTTLTLQQFKPMRMRE